LRLRFGELVLDPDSRQLFRDGAEVHLQPKTFELLDLLVRSRPKALSKQHIRGQLWPDTVVGDAGDGASAITGPTALPDDSRFRLGRVLLVFRSSPEAGSTMTEHRG
jgi:hypothetical protein